MELWPRLLDREPHRQAVRGFAAAHEHHLHQAAINVRKLLHVWQLSGAGLCRGVSPGTCSRSPRPRHSKTGWTRSSSVPTIPKRDAWLGQLEAWREADWEAMEAANAKSWLPSSRQSPILNPQSVPAPQAADVHRTAQRSFEVAYWNTIPGSPTASTSTRTMPTACDDPVTRSLLKHHHRDLEALGDYLLDYYRRTIERHGMTGKALGGDLPFVWQTDFDFSWSGGWCNNQDGKTEERDLLVVIPGRDRRRAVIMADHYDTAYMEDRYEKQRGGNGARLAAAGADDNHSATAALMLGAPVFLELSRAGRLGCDVWLVHLTGEEFPSDCMGARHLAQWLVERSLKLRVAGPPARRSLRHEGPRASTCST